MKKYDTKLFSLTDKELRKTSVNKFADGTRIYVTVNNEPRYIIHLKKTGGKYPYGMKTRIEDAKTSKFISIEFRPKYIVDFIYNHE
jgi:hypothetical protein